MNKKKIFTYLFIGLLTVGATGTMTSCKDYDDDINDLKDQISKAALKSDVDALKTQLSSVESTANAAKDKAEANATEILKKANQTDLDAVKATAEKAGETAASAVTAAANAQASADNAATVAKAAQALAETANKAASENTKSIGTINETLKTLQNKISGMGSSADVTAEITKAINDAKAEIAKNYATKSEVSTAIAPIAKLASEAATAKALKDSCSALEDKIVAASDAQTAALKTVVDAYKVSVNQLFTALTSVELFASYSGTGLNVLDAMKGIDLTMMHGLVPEDSKFGDNESGLNKDADPIIAFVKGADIKSNGGVIVKVNPVNADITKATIKLINSKGEVLDEVVAGTPVKYDELITRTRANVGSGLWKIPFTVKNGTTEEAFKNATTADGKDILYAVAICNTDSATDRYISSTYDLGTKYEPYAPSTELDYSVNGKDVKDIHNRWNFSDGKYLTMTEDAKKLSDDESLFEKTWAAATKENPAPTAVPTKKNVKVDLSDVRYGNAPLHVEVGQAFSIKLKNDKAAYYYVTLDEKRAIESAPSEVNAWNGYKYDGLLKNVAADSTLSLKINSAEANGDIIGFRVFAVNADGTLQDPDGRAFYVQVGDAANTENVAGNDTITSAKGWTGSIANATKNVVDIALTKTFQSSKSNLQGFLTLDDASKANLLNDEKPEYILLDKDKKPATDWKDAKYVRVGVVNGANWKDDTKLFGTVKAVKDGSSTSAEVTLNTLNITVTKVLPTSTNYKLSFRPMQEDGVGTGRFTMYLVPENGWNVTPTSENGNGDFTNIFYNLPPNVTFTIANAAVQGDKDVDKVVTENGKATDETSHYNFSEAVKFIDSKTYRKLTAAINFGKISSKSKDDYKITVNQDLNVRFACWETANTYAWGTKKDGKNTVSLQPQIMWDANGNYSSYELGTLVKVTNSYNPVLFNGDFEKLFVTNKYLEIVAGSAKFTYGDQENPYFTPEINKAGKVTITKNQTTFAPTADHDENLVFKVKDAYGHEKEISLAVKVLRPAEK